MSVFEQNDSFLKVTLAFGVGTRLLGGGGVAVVRLQGHGVMRVMLPPRSAGGVLSRLSPTLSLRQQTGGLPPGTVSELLPVLAIQLKPGDTDSHDMMHEAATNHEKENQMKISEREGGGGNKDVGEGEIPPEDLGEGYN